jgi:Protein of unknown function (DUF2637)
VTDRLIKVTTALAVVAVALVAAVISYQHAFELVHSHGESGVTARLLPFTVDGLIWAASMVVLDASRRGQPVPRLAAWSVGTGIVATVGANLAHGVGHGPVGALVSAWPALALVGSFEMLMMLIRTGRGTRANDASLDGGTRLHHHWHKMHRWNFWLRQPWSRPSMRATKWATAARHRPRIQHRPPQSQAHPQPNGMTQRTDLELSYGTSLRILNLVGRSSAACAASGGRQTRSEPSRFGRSGVYPAHADVRSCRSGLPLPGLEFLVWAD